MQVEFSEVRQDVDVFGFAEVIVQVSEISTGNVFRDVQVSGTLTWSEGSVNVDGFCDSASGAVYKIRFMPRIAGEYRYTVAVSSSDGQASIEGTFEASDKGRKGLLQIDPNHPFHFIRSGSGENFFWNGTTAYFLFGWDYEGATSILDRLSTKGVNQARVALNARTYGGSNWSEDNVVETDRFSFRVCPWVAANPESAETPEVDVTRYNVEHWQHVERVVEYARLVGITISVIFYVDGQHARVDPFGKDAMGSNAEVSYYRYAAARLAAFENVIWCVTNEYHLFRNDEWVEQTGTALSQFDPYGHITSVHGFGEFHFMGSTWPGYASYQVWDEPGGNAFMLGQRALQLESGRVMPQVNEEYGYEDTYPQWGFAYVRPMRNADSRRKIAWSISMAGCYQTTGERADNGTGAGPDTGGGWINGRGDDTMVMLDGYKIMVDFFTSIPWYRLEPSNDLVQTPALCLAEAGSTYIVYLPDGSQTIVELPDGDYTVLSLDPGTGLRETKQVTVTGSQLSLSAPTQEDHVYLISSAAS